MKTKESLPLSLGNKVLANILDERYQVTVRGWKEDEYILLDLPVFQGSILKAAPQAGCSISYTLDGTFINFKTTISHILTQPIRLLLLEYPKSFSTHNLRKNFRQRVNFSFFYSRESNPNEFTFTGTIRDLSLSGALITHEKPLEKNETIALTVNLPQGKIANLPGRVKNIRNRPNTEREPFVTGLEFNGLSPEQDSVIRKFVESRISERRGTDRVNGLQ